MFLKQMGSINNDAKKQLELIKQKIQETQEKLVGVLTNVLHVFVDECAEASVPEYSHPESLPQEGYSGDSSEQRLKSNSGIANLKNQEESLFNKLNNVFVLDGGADKLLNECEAMNAYRTHLTSF
jgi:hypothetical protein